MNNRAVFQLQTVPLASIVVADDRPLDQTSLRSLTKAIERDGLKRPLDVMAGWGFAKAKFKLVDGRHRKAALVNLGATHVLVRVMSKREALTWKHSANLHQRVQSILDRSEDIASYSRSLPKSVYKLGGHQPHDRSIKRVAEDLGFSRKLVSEAFLHARISDAIKEQIRQTPIANNRAKLTAIASLTSEEEQLKLILPRSRPKKTFSEVEVDKTDPLAALMAYWQQPPVSNIFAKLSADQRLRFAETIFGQKLSFAKQVSSDDW